MIDKNAAGKSGVHLMPSRWAWDVFPNIGHIALGCETLDCGYVVRLLVLIMNEAVESVPGRMLINWKYSSFRTRAINAMV